MTTKRSQRARGLARRAAITQADLIRYSAACVARLRQIIEYARAKHVAIYFPLPSEISPLLLAALDSASKKFYLPVVQANNSLLFARFRRGEKLQRGRLGTLEPNASKEDLRTVSELDFIVMPGVAYDLHGNRLGMGGGCYDRTLQTKSARGFGSTAHTVLFVATEQLLDHVVSESTDVKPKFLITPAYEIATSNRIR